MIESHYNKPQFGDDVNDIGGADTPSNSSVDHNKSRNSQSGKVHPLSTPNGSEQAPPSNYIGHLKSDPEHIEEAPLMNAKDFSPRPTTPNYAKPVTLTFKDLAYEVTIKNPNKAPGQPKTVQRPILKGLTGVCKPGQLTAIMGASGAGKTTLLNILSCRVGSKGLSGEYCANGNPYNVSKFSKFAGYVMQNDILLETMTPRETLNFTAALRIKGTPEEKKAKVEKLIKGLKLDRAADTFIGGTFLKGISGGERKRTSIGVELMTDPNLLFLDEPTSGLDSFTAFILISLLKNLAVTEGKNIIFTIHQPSSDIFFMFDNLMILAKGKFIYQGPTVKAVDHFNSIGYQCPEHFNPADYFIEVAHSEKDDDQKFVGMYDAYDKHLAPAIKNEVEHVQKDELKLAEKTSTFLNAVGVVAKRSMMNFLRNPILLRGRIGQTVVITFLMCVLFFRLSKDMDGTDQNLPVNKEVIYNINGSLFFFCISTFMGACMSVVLTFPAERAVFLREYSANMYSVTSYYFGKSTTEIPLAILFPVIQVCIAYYIIGFNDYSAGKFFMFMLIIVSVSLAGNATGILVGSIFSDAKVASNVIPVFLLPVMLFTGVFINIASIPVWLRWIQYISPFRYALEALFWNQYTDFQLGTYQITYYNFTIGMWGAWGCLFGVMIGFRILALVSLRILVRKLQ